MKGSKSTNTWSPKGHSKKTSIGRGKRTRYKNKGSSTTPPKGYRKRYRGQGK